MRILRFTESVRTPDQALLRLLLASALALLLPACDSGKGASAKGNGAGPPPPSARKVQSTRATERRLERVVVALGSLLAHEKATLSAKVPGRVQELKVDLGSQVERGEVVALIEPRDYELQVQQAAAALAQARAVLDLPPGEDHDQVDPDNVSSVKESRAVLDEAKANFDRITRLAREKLVSESETGVAQSAYLVALNRYGDARSKVRQQQAIVSQRRAELDIARQRLEDTVIRAPFAGGIQSRPANLGEYLTIGSPLVTLVCLDPLRLRVEVPEREAPQVRVGQTVRLTLEGDTNAYTGQVHRLSPALDEQNRMLIVEADIRNDGRLHPGYFARAQIVTAPDATALCIPSRALTVFAGVQKALTVQDGKALEKRIVTGQQGPDWVEVLSGLTPGEEVILNPGNLQTGQPVVRETAAR